MVDSTAFFSLSYGMFVIGAKSETERAGCIVNTFIQVTSQPMQVSVAINKENHTAQVIRETGRLSATVLDESAPMELIGTFGFHTSTELDKFAQVQSAEDENGIPYVTEHACAHFSAKVVQTADVGSHYIFICEVEQAEKLGSEPAMTYAYYHQVKGGKTPPKASSYNDAVAADDAKAEEPAKSKIAWRCSICGYIEYADELPDDYTCPVCGAGKDAFERV